VQLVDIPTSETVRMAAATRIMAFMVAMDWLLLDGADWNRNHETHPLVTNLHGQAALPRTL